MASDEFVRWTSQVPFFSGRDSFLQTLRETLLQSQAAVVVGPDGVGKTALAREYVYRFSREYQQVFWLNAASNEIFMADMLELAQRLSLAINPAGGIVSAFQTLQNWLAQQENFLLVLDGLASRHLARSFSAGQRTNRHILMVARESDVLPQLKLDPLDEQSGALLTLRRAGYLSQAADEQSLVAQELAGKLLHGSPVALKLAGGYLKVTGSRIESYLQVCRDNNKEDNQGIAFSCGLLLSYLKQEQPLAFELLLACSFLSPDTIPGALFTQPAYGQQKPEEAIQLLSACGLLAVEKSTISIHPLIQAAVRQSLPIDEQQQRVERLLRAFHQLLLAQGKEPLPVRVRLAGHLLRLAVVSEEWTLAFDEAAEVFGWAGSLLWAQGLIQDAETLLRRALVIWESTQGIPQEQLATILFNLATLNCLLKNYRTAEAFSQRSILTIARALGSHHHDVLLYLTQLGHIYAEQDKPQEARLCYEKAIITGDQAGLQNRPYYISATYDLALFCIDNDLFNEAEPLLQTVCAAWELSPDTRNPSIVDAWLKYAQVSAKLHYWQQAEICYQRILQVYAQQTEALPGEEHPDILPVMEQLARAYLLQEKPAESEVYFLRVLNARERSLGSDHPGVATCLNGLAMVKMERKQFDEARPLLARALSIYERREGPDDLALAEILDNLVIIETVQEQFEQAISLSQKTLEIRQRILGEDHLDLVENLSRLATLYLMTERSDQAEPLLLHALTIYQNEQMPEDLTFDPVLTGLATIEMEHANYWQAKMYLERSRAIRSEFLGAESSSLAEVLCRLASIAVAEEEWQEAEPLYLQALSIYQGVPGSEQQILECLEQVAAVLARLERYEEARTALQKVLQGKENELGTYHLDLVGTLLALGQLCLLQEQFKATEMYLQRTMDVYEQHPGVQPFGAVFLFSSLTTALENRGELERAASLSRKASVLNEQVLRAANMAREMS